MSTPRTPEICELFVEHAQLSEQHHLQLKTERALCDEVIARNFLTATPAALMPALNKVVRTFGVEDVARDTLLVEPKPDGGYRLHSKLSGGGVVVIYRNAAGVPFHLAPIKDGYENLPPEVFGLDSVKDSARRVYVAESEIKAIMCHQIGLQAISVQGVDAFSGEHYPRLLEALRSVGARELVIVYDNADYLSLKLPDGRANPKCKSDPKKTFKPELRAYELALRLQHDGMQVGHVRLKDEWRVDGEADIDGVIASGKATEDELRAHLEAPLDHEAFLNALPPEGKKRALRRFGNNAMGRTPDGVYHYRSYPIDIFVDKVHDKKNGRQANVRCEWNRRPVHEARVYVDRDDVRLTFANKVGKKVGQQDKEQTRAAAVQVQAVLVEAVAALKEKRDEEKKEQLERRLARREAANTVSAFGSSFIIRDSGISKLVKTESDEEIEVEISNFLLDIKRQETIDDGKESTRIYVADLIRGDQRTEIEIPAK